MIDPNMAMVSSYDYRLVVLSVVIAIFASYAALDLAGRTTAASGRTRLAWLVGGATAMGVGIWSMHYIGMLAFSLLVPVLYDWPTVLLSLLAAVLDRKSTRLNSSHGYISYAVFCLKKKKKINKYTSSS